MFGRKKEPPVNRRTVMDLVAAEMKCTDRDDMEHDRPARSAELRRLERRRDEVMRRASLAERQAAHEALRRHGY